MNRFRRAGMGSRHEELTIFLLSLVDLRASDNADSIADVSDGEDTFYFQIFDSPRFSLILLVTAGRVYTWPAVSLHQMVSNNQRKREKKKVSISSIDKPGSHTILNLTKSNWFSLFSGREYELTKCARSVRIANNWRKLAKTPPKSSSRSLRSSESEHFC